MLYVYAFLTVFLIVYCITPILSRFAFKLDFLDKPTERKKHKEPIPLFGGLAILTGFIVGYLIFIKPIEQKFISVLLASIMVFAIGLVDDWHKTKGKEFPIWPRITTHILAAILIYSSGIVFRGYTNPFTHRYILLPVWVQFFLSITWILGMTTVINWTDGVDGLAGSLSTMSASTLFVVALAKGQPASAVMSAILAGSTLGFLKYNRHPAKVFMGDSGANFLGFILSIIALDGAFKQTTVVSILIPILALGVPIFDNIFVVVNRFLKGRPIYQADATQIHHRLQSSGLNPKQVVTFLCLVSMCFSLLSIIILILKL